jgi:iron complex outermembrane receptor protein
MIRSGCCALIAVSLSLFAQTPPPVPAPPAPVQKDTMVVTGSYLPLPLDEADRAVTSQPVRGQELLQNTWIDSLQLDPAVDVRQRGVNGTQADLSIRGSTFGQTLVLLNGRRMNDVQSGHHNMDMPVPLESVTSVETLRGAGSTLYGSDAIGGAVNLITAPPESGEIRVRTAFGSFGTNQERVSMTGVLGKLSEQLTASRDFSSGFMPDRDYRSLLFGSSTSYKSALGNSELDLGYSDRPFGADQFYGNYPSWERTKAWFAGLRQSIGERTEADFSYRRHSDLFVLFRDHPEIYTNRHIAESWQASLRRRETFSPATTLYYGAEGFGDTIESTNLGSHDRLRAAAYASLDMRVLKSFSLSVGARQESYHGFTQFSPTVSAGYWASSKLKLRGGVSRAFRLPTFTDLYYHDPANLGNADLVPETAWSYEGGAEWRINEKWQAEATAFRRNDNQVIDYVRSTPLEPWRATNVHSLQFTGVETDVSWKLRRSVVDFRYTGLSGVSAALPGLQSKYAFNYPVHSGTAGWSGILPWQIAARTRIGALERLGRNPYAIWDAYFARSQGRVRPFVQFTNLTSTHYQEIVGVEMPGRAILGGVEILVWR